MDKKDIIEFFDRLAPGWDAGMVRNEPVIASILDNAGVTAGKKVLDVACGTGVLIPDYLRRNASVTGIDISTEMIRVAKEKFAGEKDVTLVAGDVEEYEPEELFDVIMVYNAFPHFPDPKRLLEKLASLCAPGGTLSIAHGMSRAKLAEHHSGSARKVSIGLDDAETLASMFAPLFRVTVKIDAEDRYQVVGERLPF